MQQICGIPNNVNYESTLGVEVEPFYINNQHYSFWDCAGNALVRGLGSDYYREATLFIIFTGGNEANNPINYGNKAVNQWIAEIQNVCPYAQIQILQNPSVNQILALL